MEDDLDTNKIKDWRSIVTLVVFVLTNISVLFPFHIPIYLPRGVYNAILDISSALRITPPRNVSAADTKPWERLQFPMNMVTAPLIADLFLLAILAIGRREVHDGTLGTENISPLDIMIFFITLAYIAISIDASGLIRYLAFRVLQWAGKAGHRLFFFLYAFFFLLATFVGNDPIILSGTAFLAYMTRVSSNIVHPRAWIFTQFSVANIASAILVSSNPTNLVLAGAFQIKFINYTANMIVPVVVTAIVLFPFLLYVVFRNEELIPKAIEMHELPPDERGKEPVNPNIPNASGLIGDEMGEEGKLLPLEEIMNPFLDKKGAIFGSVLMAATLITVLALNAASADSGEHPVFWVTLPAAFVMFCWDLATGWIHRKETREIARRGRHDLEERGVNSVVGEGNIDQASSSCAPQAPAVATAPSNEKIETDMSDITANQQQHNSTNSGQGNSDAISSVDEKGIQKPEKAATTSEGLEPSPTTQSPKKANAQGSPNTKRSNPTTLVSMMRDSSQWLRETFPTTTTVFMHLPFPLVPFAFSMFVLVQALVTKGWVPVFAYGWEHWVNRTGVIGAIGGMGFLSVILCNFAGTNIGTTILLSRVIQAWQEIHRQSGQPISQRVFWATVYSMALGVNYGAFSTAFSASLAGLLWRDILAKKHIKVGSLEFARVNLPIITISMIVGSAVLIGQIYITRDP